MAAEAEEVEERDSVATRASIASATVIGCAGDGDDMCWGERDTAVVVAVAVTAIVAGDRGDGCVM